MGTLLAGGAAAAAAVYGAHQLSHGAHHLGHGGHHGFGHGKFKHGKFKHGKFGKRWKHGGFGKHKFKRWKWYGLKAYVMVWAKGFNFHYWTGKRLQHCHSSITINEFWMIFFFFLNLFLLWKCHSYCLCDCDCSFFQLRYVNVSHEKRKFNLVIGFSATWERPQLQPALVAHLIFSREKYR